MPNNFNERKIKMLKNNIIENTWKILFQVAPKEIVSKVTEAMSYGDLTKQLKMVEKLPDSYFIKH